MKAHRVKNIVKTQGNKVKNPVLENISIHCESADVGQTGMSNAKFNMQR